jgi:hypothetical protein
VIAIITPYSDTHRNVNIIYTVATAVSLTLYMLSYYYKKTNLIIPAYSVVAIRNLIRLVDFEETRLHMNITHLL